MTKLLIDRSLVEQAFVALGIDATQGFRDGCRDELRAALAQTEQPEQLDSYDEIYNAFDDITSAAAILPTYETVKEGGIGAVAYNMVIAIEKARELLQSKPVEPVNRVPLDALLSEIDKQWAAGISPVRLKMLTQPTPAHKSSRQ